MDIESKKYRVRSTDIAGQVCIECKETRQRKYIHSSDVPQSYLGQCHERYFDKWCKEQLS